jgi:hypothetical protein
MKIQKTKNFGVRTKKINYFTIGPENPPKRPNSLRVWIDQKKYFSMFCYLIRVEHKKC